MREVTEIEVVESILNSGIDRIDHHECGICGFMVKYLIHEGSLYFDPACDCGSHYSRPEPRPFKDLADWHNMQSTESARARLRKLFGMAE